MRECNNLLFPSGNKFCTFSCNQAPTKPITLLHVDMFCSNISRRMDKALQNANINSDVH